MKIMVTGFDPFGGDKINPSWEAVQALPEHIGQIQVQKCRIPTEFEGAVRRIREKMDEIQPDAVLCLGLYGGCPSIRVERVAINLQDARIPDNAGAQPQDKPVRPEGPDAYFSTIPTRKFVEAMTSRGIPAVLSYSAGTYVCNTLLYAVLDHCARQGLRIPCGFLHIPCSPEMASAMGGNTPSMDTGTVVRALTIAMECL